MNTTVLSHNQAQLQVVGGPSRARPSVAGRRSVIGKIDVTRYMCIFPVCISESFRL